MDADAALSALLELSTQVVEAVVSTTDGTVEAARTAGADRTAALAAAGPRLLSEAASLRAGGDGVERVHVDCERGSLAVASDGGRTIVVTTVAEPTAGLLAYDLRTTLARLAEAP